MEVALQSDGPVVFGWGGGPGMSAGVKFTVIAVAVLGIVSTPLFWLLDGPGSGQLAAAAVQAATAIAALVWAVLHRPAGPDREPGDAAVDTGKAQATGGGQASTGVRRPGGAGSGSARAERTGDATAEGPGSTSTTGVDHS